MLNVTCVPISGNGFVENGSPFDDNTPCFLETGLSPLKWLSSRPHPGAITPLPAFPTGKHTSRKGQSHLHNLLGTARIG